MDIFNRFILIFCILMLIFVIGCINKVRQQEISESIGNNSELVGQNSNECDKEEYQGGKDACYSNLARGKKEDELCEVVVDQISKDLCYSGIATEKENISICNKIKTYRKDECYKDVAIKKQDISICNEIETQDFKYWCIAVVTSNPSLCGKINAGNRVDICYMKFVMEGNYEFCDKIVNEALRQSCNSLRMWKQFNNSSH